MHDTGYRELGGTCTAVMPTPPPSNSMIDCGPNGTFNGRACSCDEGYTQTGLGEGAYQIDVDIQAGEPPMCASPGASCRSGPDCCSGNCHVGHCH